MKKPVDGITWSVHMTQLLSASTAMIIRWTHEMKTEAAEMKANFARINSSDAAECLNNKQQ